MPNFVRLLIKSLFLWVWLWGSQASCASPNQSIVIAGQSWYSAGHYEQALAEAKLAQVPLLLLWTADWCMPCQELKAYTLSDQSVQALTNSFVRVYLDSDDGAAQEIANRHQLRGYPRILIVDQNDQKIASIGSGHSIASYLAFFDHVRRFPFAALTVAKQLLQKTPAPSVPSQHAIEFLLTQMDQDKELANYAAQQDDRLRLLFSIWEALPADHSGRLRVAADLTRLVNESERGDHQLVLSPAQRASLQTYLTSLRSQLKTTPGFTHFSWQLISLLKISYGAKWEDEYRSWRHALKELRDDESVSPLLRLFSFRPEIDYLQAQSSKLPMAFKEELSIFCRDLYPTLSTTLPQAERNAVIQRMTSLLEEGEDFLLARDILTKERQLNPDPSLMEDWLGNLAVEEKRYDVAAKHMQSSIRLARAWPTKLLRAMNFMELLMEHKVANDLVLAQWEFVFAEAIPPLDDVHGESYRVLAHIIRLAHRWTPENSSSAAFAKFQQSLLDRCGFFPSCQKLKHSLATGELFSVADDEHVALEARVFERGGKQVLGVAVFTDPQWHILEQENQAPLELTFSSDDTQSVAQQSIGSAKNATGHIYLFEGKDAWLTKGAAFRANVTICGAKCVPIVWNFVLTEQSDGKRRASMPVWFQVSEPDLAALYAQVEAPGQSSLAQALYFFLLAVFGGMILNFFPCTLPVALLKVTSILSMRHSSRKVVMGALLAYGLGVLVSFWSLAAGTVILRGLGSQLGLGYHLQSPLFVCVMTLALFIFGLNSMGLLSFATTSLAIGVSNLDRWSRRFHSVYAKEFLGGCIVTLLAAPCSAPLVGSAVGFALSTSNANVFLIFTGLGLGLIFPFILVALLPKTAKLLPHSGAWLDQFKRLVGLSLIGASVWLLSVFTHLASADDVAVLYWLLFGISGYAFGKWIWPERRGHYIAMAALVLGTTFFLSHLGNDPSEEDVSAWKAAPIAELEGKQVRERPALVKVTAAWCLTCQFDDLTIFRSKSFQDLVTKHDVDLYSLDWTRRGEDIYQFLRRHGTPAVPAYFLIDKQGNIIDLGDSGVLRNITTKLEGGLHDSDAA